MQIRELKESQKLDEKISDYIGDYGAAAIKSAFGKSGGKSVRAQMAQDIFLKDFVDDAISSLESAIDSEYVDPNLKTSSQPVDPNTVQPGTSPKKTTSRPASQSTKSNQQSTVNLNNYVKKLATEINKVTDINQKMKLTKEIVTFMADQKNTPGWENASGTVKNIIKNSQLDPGFVNAAVNRLNTGKTMAESWTIYCINKLLEDTGFVWRNLDLVVLKEENNYFIVSESCYRYDILIENMLAESAESRSISQFMTNWFSKYMQGVDYTEQQDIISRFLKQIEDTYEDDQGQEVLKKLGKLSWAISNIDSPAQPSSDDAIPGKVSSTPLDTDPDKLATDVRQRLKKLHQMDPKLYSDIAKEIGSKP